MTNDLLDIDIKVLLLRYGRKNVLQALARTTEQTLDEVQKQLQILAERNTTKAKRAKPSILDMVTAHAQTRPDIAEPLRTAALAFENRTFLPQLRDVQRFLERNGTTHGKLKSRAATAPLVLRTLASLPPDELFRLTTAEMGSKDSDYAILARAIMGTSPPKPIDEPEKISPPADKD